MRIYIRSSESPIKIYIDITFDLVESERVAASTDSLSRPESDDFQVFVTNVYSTILSCGFNILDYEISDKVNSESTYFSIAKQDDIARKAIKCLLFIRLSDHPLDSSRAKQHHAYYEKKAQSMKIPKDKSHQRWKLVDITVDGVKYTDYYDAIDSLEKLLNRL